MPRIGPYQHFQMAMRYMSQLMNHLSGTQRSALMYENLSGAGSGKEAIKKMNKFIIMMAIRAKKHIDEGIKSLGVDPNDVEDEGNDY